jgi:mannitol/fructose-specific phosphotransferase system IIA component (Ntr-type)
VLSGNGWREGLTIGGGMNGRGAVEIIVAGIALEMGLISREVFSILVFMAIFTTATVPFFLKWGTEWLRRRGELVRSEGRRSGTIILGAGPTAREVARALASGGEVRLVDTNPARCRTAEAEGLAVTCGDALREQTLGEAHASDAAALLALTPNVEVNALVARMAGSVFMVPEVLVATDGAHSTGHAASMQHVGASTLFGVPVPLAEWDYWIEHGGVRQRRVPVGTELSTRGWLTSFGIDGQMLPIAIARGEERLPFHSGQTLRPGDEILLLERVDVAPDESDRFDQLVAAATIIDLPGEITLDRFFARTSDELAPVLDLGPNDLFRLLWDREHAGSTVLTPGLAIPHMLLPGEGRFEMMIARCREGVRFPTQEAPVTAIFVLASTADQRTLHLRALSAITQIVHDRGFEERWSRANGPGELREVIRRAKRRRF